MAIDSILEKSITVEDLEEKYKPLLNNVAELVMSHTEIPEGVIQADLLEALTTVTKELDTSLRERVPEHIRLQEKINKLEKLNEHLKDTNQRQHLRLGSMPDPAQMKEADEKRLPTFEEIGKMIESI